MLPPQWQVEMLRQVRELGTKAKRKHKDFYASSAPFCNAPLNPRQSRQSFPATSSSSKSNLQLRLWQSDRVLCAVLHAYKQQQQRQQQEPQVSNEMQVLMASVWANLRSLEHFVCLRESLVRN